MEATRASELQQNLNGELSQLKRDILKLEAIIKVCKDQPNKKVQQEIQNFIEALETIVFNTKQTLKGDYWK